MIPATLLCFLTISVAASQGCPILTFATPNYDCQYMVKNDPSNQCQGNIFDSCKVIPHNISLVSFQRYNQQECSQYCCDNVSPINLFCTTLVESSQNIVMIIAAISIFVFLIIAFFCLYKFGEDCCFFIHRCFRRRNNQIINAHPSANLINDTQSNLYLFSHKKWQSDSSKLQTLQCSVCLCDNPNFQLPCGHIFHQQCIFECFRRKYQCILCRRTNLTSFKFYCKRCLNKYKTVLYFQLKDLEQSEEKLCDSCVVQDQLKVEIIQ